MKIVAIHMEPWNANKHPQGLRIFDNVKLVALNQCPTYGIVRYEHHKLYVSNRRMMALEAGLAAHQAFASVRLGDLYLNGHEFYNDIDPQLAAVSRALSMWGRERTDRWLQQINSGEDMERAIMLGALDVFETTGFYDDPEDKRRTIANIEESLIAYVSRYPLGKMLPVVIPREGERPFVGVEIPVDMYLRIETHGAVYEYNFRGRVDGVQWRDYTRSEVSIEDDKTAARLDDAWRMSWTTNHQPTGYCLAISALMKMPVLRGYIRGMAIPLPKTYDYGGIVSEPFTRTEWNFERWAQWIIHTDITTRDYVDKPFDAPMFTHSCNRYFRPCPMVPFCDSPREERELMFDEMETVEWNPLEEMYHDEI